MQDRFYESIVHKMPTAYANHRIVCDERGVPCDYIFLDVNPAFERLFGIPAAELLGRKATEVMPGLIVDPFDWIGFYGSIAIDGGSREFDQYSEFQKSWYHVLVFSPEKFCFVTYISDITASMSQLTELDLFFKITPDLLCIADLSGRLIRVNKAWRAILGYAPEELRKESIFRFGDPDEREQVNKDFARLVSEYRLTNIAYRLRCKDGSYKYIEWSTQRHGDRIYAVGRDITERRKVEQDLKAERSLTDAIFNSVPGILYLYDEKRRLIRWNRRHEQITGFSADELKGKSLLDWFKGDRDSLGAISGISRDTLLAGSGEGEARLQRKDGSRIDMYFTATKHDIDGKPYFTGIGIDVSNLKKVEKNLIDSRERLKAILLSVGDAVITTDSEGKVELMNFIAEELTGWNQDEAIGKRLEDVFRVREKYDQGAACTDVFRLILSAEKPAPFGSDLILTHRNGNSIPIENTTAPIFSSGGTVSGIVSVFRDATEKLDKVSKIEYLSYHDTLTGLYNRRFFEEEIRRLNTERNLPVSIIMGDINRLKLINDAFGHARGDEYLKKAAMSIQRGCRSEDLVARWGGDEFIIFLPRTSMDEAREVAGRIKELCAAETVNSIAVSISFGIDTETAIQEDMATTIRNAEDRMYEAKTTESEAARSDMIGTIQKTLYRRNPAEERHARRVSELCRRIGSEMGFSDTVIAKLAAGGMLHDIGKISVDGGILEKSEKLTDEEWQYIKKHSAIGYRIVSSAQELIEVGEAILAHHERWDGTGYPKGIKWHSIPILARIITIADSFDSMTGDNPYKDPISVDEAIEEIRRNEGSQFDPDIAELFIKKVLIKETGSL